MEFFKKALIVTFFIFVILWGFYPKMVNVTHFNHESPTYRVYCNFVSH